MSFIEPLDILKGSEDPLFTSSVSLSCDQTDQWWAHPNQTSTNHHSYDNHSTDSNSCGDTSSVLPKPPSVVQQSIASNSPLISLLSETFVVPTTTTRRRRPPDGDVKRGSRACAICHSHKIRCDGKWTLEFVVLCCWN
jgi:hypothetical protein